MARTSKAPNTPLSHVDEHGAAHMVDVTAKEATRRTAVAAGTLQTSAHVVQLISTGGLPKGDALATARVAGILAAKRTSDLIPLCHPLPLEDCQIEIKPDAAHREVAIHCRVLTHAKTGVEMEALTGATVAALTLYDMGKAVSHGITIREVRLVEKTGGKSDYRPAASD